MAGSLHQQQSSISNYDIFFTKSTDNGTSFGTTINLSDSITGDSIQPEIAISGNNDIYVVWSENENNGLGEIFFRASTDGGATFESVTALSSLAPNESGSHSSNPRIAASGNYVYATWGALHDNCRVSDLVFASSDDRGLRFVTKSLSTNLIFGESQISVTQDTVHVVWEGVNKKENASGSSIDVFYTRSLDNGQSFDRFIAFDDDGISKNAEIASAGNNVVIAWENYDSGKAEIFLRESRDNGATFGTEENISKNPGNSLCPTIAVDENKTVHIAWEENPSTSSDILFTRTVL